MEECVVGIRIQHKELLMVVFDLRGVECSGILAECTCGDMLHAYPASQTKQTGLGKIFFYFLSR
jgi:hypothetical protein